MAGLVPAIPMRRARRFAKTRLAQPRALLIEITGTSPVMTSVGESISSEHALIRLGSARFRLLFGEHFPGGFKLPLGARVPGRRIDEGMRVSWLSAGELLGTLVDAAARIAVRVLPGMGHDIDLHALHGVQLLSVLHALLRPGKARRAEATAAPDAAIGLRTIVQREAFNEQIARRVTWRRVEDQMLIAEVEVVALMHFHVALWHFARLVAVAVVGLAGESFDHLPVFGRRHDARAGEFLQTFRAAEMVEVAMVDDDVFDVVRIDADLPDIRLDQVDEGLLRRVEQDVALRGLQDPRRHVARTDMVEIVEDLEGLHHLDLDFARAGTDAADLLERIVGRNLRVGTGGSRSSGGAGRSSFGFRGLRQCRRPEKTGGHKAARRQHPHFSHPILPWSAQSVIDFLRRDQSIAMASAMEIAPDYSAQGDEARLTRFFGLTANRLPP